MPAEEWSREELADALHESDPTKWVDAARALGSCAGRAEFALLEARREFQAQQQRPIPMLLTCPSCSARHIDKGEFATKPHHTHACQSCGMVWRPALVNTVGVQFLPGFKDPEES